MSVFQAFRLGFRTTLRNVKAIFWLLVASILLALTPTLIVSESIEDSVRDSRAARNLKDGYDHEWFKEFESKAEGLASTFHPSVAGAGALFGALDRVLDGGIFTAFTGVAAIGFVYLGVWIFAAGGLLRAFKRGYGSGLVRFCSDGADCFWRFLRLAALSSVAYWLIYTWLIPLLSGFVDELTRETIDERVAFTWTAGKYAIALMALMSVNMVSDYAKILTVLENRRSMLLAVFASGRLCLKNILKVGGLYLTLAAFGVLLMLLYAMLAPSTSQQSWISVAWALVLGQVFLASRIGTRILFLAGQMEMAAGLLAPAAATPAPLPATVPVRAAAEENPASPSQPSIDPPSPQPAD